MTAFTLYCPDCNRDIVIQIPHGEGEENSYVWAASCQHGKQLYLAYMHGLIDRINNAQWIEGW